MTEARETFPVLEDASTKLGIVLTKVAEGDASSGKNYLGALAFKDGAGNLRFPKVDAQDRVLVSAGVGDTAELWERGEAAAGSATFVDVTGAVIALQTGMSYKQIKGVVSCRRGAHFQVVWVDDAVSTIIADVRLEAGQYTQAFNLDLPFDSGATGTQSLKLVAKNFEALPLSALGGTIGVTEVQ